MRCATAETGCGLTDQNGAVLCCHRVKPSDKSSRQQRSPVIIVEQMRTVPGKPQRAAWPRLLSLRSQRRQVVPAVAGEQEPLRASSPGRTAAAAAAQAPPGGAAGSPRAVVKAWKPEAVWRVPSTVRR